MSIASNILIVGDELGISQELRSRLEKKGNIIKGVVRSGEEALRVVKTEALDLILMDIKLEGEMNGIETAQQVHEIADIPTIYLINAEDELSLEMARLGKAYGYLPKPVEERSLLSTMEFALYNHKMDLELKQREEWYRGIVERNFDATVNLDLDGLISYASPSIMRISGYTASEVVGRSFLNFLPESDHESASKVFSATMEGDVVKGIELKIKHKNGEEIHIEAIWMPILKKDRIVGSQCIFKDITARKEAELELQHMATHDYLTDLPNIRLFLEHLEKALDRARRSGLCVALLYLDLDGFKHINDRYGHGAGDEVLRMVAKRLMANVRRADVVARLGGDEFSVLMTDLPCSSRLDSLVERLHRTIREPFALRSIEANVTVSIGISLFPMDAQDSAALIRYADQAMLHSKSIGKDCYYHYSNLVDADA